MAGGIGSRFWPLSRNAKPKQFLDILGVGRTFVQQTFDRLAKIIPPENIVVVTNADYEKLVSEQLPQLPKDNILLEPLRRNTAPCIAYATHKLLTKVSDATVIVAPADHLILNEAEFISVMEQAIREAEASKNLITIGIKPNRPETGYGYIQVANVKEAGSRSVCRVKTFTEKPTLDMAEIFVKSGEFFWNSGIFAWTLQTIRAALHAHLPVLNKLFEAGRSAYHTADEAQLVAGIYNECRAISIDYGVMEKAENVCVICADFGWSDLGTWTSLYLQLEKDADGNALPAGSRQPFFENVALNSVKNCLVHAPADKLVVLQGLDGYLVVDTHDVLMVCKHGDENELKQLINNTLIDKGMRMA
jgi:mannose-1-phosphate guanylyltransferase